MWLRLWRGCALRLTGAVFCWGTGTVGQLGNGGTATVNGPISQVTTSVLFRGAYPFSMR